MKYAGRLVALVGLAIACWLVWREHPAVILHLLRAAGAGLLLSALAHILPMLANAWDWRLLIRPAQRPSLAAMLKVVWIRESINNLLPVARIGGEIVSFRLLGTLGVRPAVSVASLVVDMQLTLISQLVFALVAIGYLLEHEASGTAHTVGQLTWAIAGLAPVLLLFALVQNARPFERIAHAFNRITSGKVYDLIGNPGRIDRVTQLIWRKTGIIVRYLFIWQTVQCCGFALEIWIALRVLGVDATFAQAFVIEALIQLISSVAFLVPGGIGVQEGGFVLVGGMLGLDAPTCLALAGARRIRDLLFYVPGLLYWQFAERSMSARREQKKSSGNGKSLRTAWSRTDGR